MKTLAHSVATLALLGSLAARGQGDLCTGATVVACGGSYAGNTTAFTADVAPFCNTTDGTGGGAWYRFTGTGNPVIASLCGSGYDTKIRVYTGTCAALVCTIGNDDFCGLQSQVTWTSVLGTTYYILVHGFGAAAGAYTLNITCPPPPVPLCYTQTAVPYAADPYAGTLVTLTDDVHSPVVNIGFTFCYNGTNYTQCVIASNNYITFNLANAGLFSPWVTGAIPNATPTQPHNAVLDPWQDINPGVGGAVRYQTLGTAPFRRFVVSYNNVPMFSCTTQLYTSQIVLYESTNCIESLILSKPVCATWNNGNAVQGLQNNGGTSATVVAGRNNTQWTAASEGRFFSPACVPCSTAFTAQCQVVPLPIELAHFAGRNVGSYNLLEWTTASERNTDHFIVERSADGELFVPVLLVDAAGNSSNTLHYTAKDPDPRPGLNIYRLRAVENDASESLSHAVTVHHDPGSRMGLHPNPSSGRVFVSLPDHVRVPCQLVLRDVSGRAVASALADGHVTGLDLARVQGGTYLIEATGTGLSATLIVE
ncbi:MAG: hypothetical protein IPJ76_06145 [Flavobacteriales bacterium]|nr:MAG: hypothetical protein IPJ76_06145 [Flavobacteriales bacterium]